MRKTILIYILFFSCFATLPLLQKDINAQEKTIFEELRKIDTLGYGTVKVFQDKRIDRLIVDKKLLIISNSIVICKGYRVQVFSSNTQRTAKTEAFKIERNLREVFPEHAVYISYNSPFWKVRIGDFKNLHEAQMFRIEVVDAFPSLKSEAYAVKDLVKLYR